MKKLYKLLSVIFATTFMLLSACSVKQPIVSEDTMLTVNPDRGFYQAMGKKFTRADNQPITRARLEQYSGYGLFHFRFGLEEFSAKMGGKDVLLSEDMLTALAETLDNLRMVDATAILRFSYDSDGVKYGSGGGDSEPDLSLVVKHVSQLGEVLKDYTDVISSIDAGMLGPWGEQHSTTLSASPQAYYEIVEAWRKNITTRTIALRRPVYCLHWYNYKYDTSFTVSQIQEAVIPSDVMLGVYNDGYLGSASDLGTYSDRETEINWLALTTAKTLFGGEVVANSGSELMGAYNNPEFMIAESAITHTSYLNVGWNYKVVDEWKKLPYTGTNKQFKDCSAYDYIAAHLGYRLILTSASITKNGNQLNVNLNINNTGFGNIVNEKSVYLVLQNDDGEHYIKVGADPRKWNAQYSEQFSADISSLSTGKYKVFLKILSETADQATLLRSIRFANKDIFSSSLAANYLCEINL